MNRTIKLIMHLPWCQQQWQVGIGTAHIPCKNNHADPPGILFEGKCR